MTKNGRITSTMLGREDHDILTFMIYVEHDCCTVSGIGGFALDRRDRETGKLIFKASGLEAISKVLEVVGVKTWEDLPNKYIRFEHDRSAWSITKIGHITEDKWVDLRDYFQ